MKTIVVIFQIDNRTCMKVIDVLPKSFSRSLPIEPEKKSPLIRNIRGISWNEFKNNL